MGQPARGNARAPLPEYIGEGAATRGTETSKYPEERKSTEIPLVAASERGASLNQCSAQHLGVAALGVVGSPVRRPGTCGRSHKGSRQPNGPERPAEEGESPVGEAALPAHGDARVMPDT